MINTMNDTFDFSLKGQLLIATPAINDPRFDRAVIFVCAHDENGAMGIVVNHPVPELKFVDLLEKLSIGSDIKLPKSIEKMPVLRGGPVDREERGFLIHSNDFSQKDTIKVQDDIYITATIDGLLSLNTQKLPQSLAFALGYAGWTAGQLESEVRRNAWLTVLATPDLIFEKDKSTTWSNSLSALGISPSQLTMFAGQA